MCVNIKTVLHYMWTTNNQNSVWCVLNIPLNGDTRYGAIPQPIIEVLHFEVVREHTRLPSSTPHSTEWGFNVVQTAQGWIPTHTEPWSTTHAGWLLHTYEEQPPHEENTPHAINTTAIGTNPKRLGLKPSSTHTYTNMLSQTEHVQTSHSYTCIKVEYHKFNKIKRNKME